MVDCHNCGQAGHVARDCQWQPEIEGRPPWCGECDRYTRLMDHATYMQRCHKCWAWPSKGTRFHQLLAHHKICGGCKTIIYQWDKKPCGSHQPLAIDAAGHRQAAMTARARQAITRQEDAHD